MTLYEILGVGTNATSDEIKKAYRNLAKEHHPDKGADGEFFKKIGEAYAILMDAAKRERYDRGESVDSIRTPEMDIEMQAVGALLSAFVEIVKAYDVRRNNITKKLASTFKTASKEIKNQIEGVDELIERFEYVKSSITRKDDGADNIFAHAADQQLKIGKQMRSKLEHDHAIALKAVEIAQKYEHNLDEMMELPSYGNISFTTYTTGR